MQLIKRLHLTPNAGCSSHMFVYVLFKFSLEFIKFELQCCGLSCNYNLLLLLFVQSCKKSELSFSL